MSLPLQFILALLLFVTSLATTAAEDKPEPWYQVELILFKQPQPAVETSEQWDSWGNKRPPVNYQGSVEITYPITHQNSVIDAGLETHEQQVSSGGILHKQAENFAGESLQREMQQQPIEAAPAGPQPFTFTLNSDWTLGEVYERLNNSNQYQLLIHTAWLQPGLGKDEAVPVHIHDHMTLIEDKSEEITGSNEGVVNLHNVNDSEQKVELSPPLELETAATTATSYPLESTLFEQSYGEELSSKKGSMVTELPEITFNGTVKVLLSRYLHFEIDMEYAPSGFSREVGDTHSEMIRGVRTTDILSDTTFASIAKGAGSGGGPLLYETSTLDTLLTASEEVQPVIYRLQQSRRMRSRELHYIDHPRIGILVNIVPVEIPQKKLESLNTES